MESQRVSLRKSSRCSCIKCLKSLPEDASWNNVKTILRQQYSLVPTITHATTKFIHRYQWKRESLQKFNFKFSELIQTFTNHKPKDITDPLKIYMYVQKLFHLSFSSETIRHAHQTLQEVIDYVWQIERKFLFVEGNSADKNLSQKYQLMQLLEMIQ